MEPQRNRTLIFIPLVNGETRPFTLEHPGEIFRRVIVVEEGELPSFLITTDESEGGWIYINGAEKAQIIDSGTALRVNADETMIWSGVGTLHVQYNPRLRESHRTLINWGTRNQLERYGYVPLEPVYPEIQYVGPAQESPENVFSTFDSEGWADTLRSGWDPLGGFASSEIQSKEGKIIKLLTDDPDWQEKKLKNNIKFDDKYK